MTRAHTIRARLTRASTTRQGRDVGLTLVELMVTMAVMAITATLVVMVLASAQRVTKRMQNSESAIDDARRVSASLDRELRSAVCIAAPGENLTGNTLTFQAVLYGSTVILTYVVANGLVTRSADLGEPLTVIDTAGPTTTAFKQLTTPSRTLVVDIPIQSANGGLFHLITTVAGRNAWRLC